MGPCSSHFRRSIINHEADVIRHFLKTFIHCTREFDHPNMVAVNTNWLDTSCSRQDCRYLRNNLGIRQIAYQIQDEDDVENAPAGFVPARSEFSVSHKSI